MNYSPNLGCFLPPDPVVVRCPVCEIEALDDDRRCVDCAREVCGGCMMLDTGEGCVELDWSTFRDNGSQGELICRECAKEVVA